MIRYTVRDDAGCPLFPLVTFEGRSLSNRSLHHVKKIIGDFDLVYISRFAFLLFV